MDINTIQIWGVLISSFILISSLCGVIIALFVFIFNKFNVMLANQADNTVRISKLEKGQENMQKEIGSLKETQKKIFDIVQGQSKLLNTLINK